MKTAKIEEYRKVREDPEFRKEEARRIAERKVLGKLAPSAKRRRDEARAAAEAAPFDWAQDTMLMEPGVTTPGELWARIAELKAQRAQRGAELGTDEARASGSLSSRADRWTGRSSRTRCPRSAE